MTIIDNFRYCPKFRICKKEPLHLRSSCGATFAAIRLTKTIDKSDIRSFYPFEFTNTNNHKFIKKEKKGIFYVCYYVDASRRFDELL